MRRVVALSIVWIGLLLIATVAHAGAPGIINSYVGVCDPNSPTHCAAPDSGGSLPVTVSGGGGAITMAAGAVAAGAYVAGSLVDGANLTEGAKADAAWSSGSGSIVAILKALDRDILLPIPAGTNVIGHVITDTGSTTAVTGNVTVVQPTGTNLHAVLDTTSTTAVTQATASNLNAQVVGPAASGASASGNPVPIGGDYNSTLPTITNGQRVTAQFGTRGSQLMTLYAQDSASAITAGSPGAADGITTNGTSLFVFTYPGLFNNSSWDRARSVINATNSIGTGITAVGTLGQFDDTSPTAITENQFGNFRMSANRNAYQTIRDAAGNERGANVDANSNLNVIAAASENHVGEIGQNQMLTTVAQTVTAASYTSGNAIGGLMTVASAARVSGSAGASGTGGLLQSVVMNAKSAQTTQVDVFLFNANPTGSTCTDKTAFVLATADFDKVFGVAHITDWTAGNIASIGQAQGMAMPYILASATSIYACAVTRSTPTYSATTDVSFGFRMLRD